MHDDHNEPTSVTSTATVRDHGIVKRHANHFAMIVCCVPVLLIATVLVVTHVVSASTLVFAVGCVVMMAVMMRGMNHDHGRH